MNDAKKLVPKLRFPEFRDADHWSPHTLGSVCNSFSGGTPSTSQPEYYGGDIPFIRSAEIARNRTELFLTTLGLTSSAAKIVTKGDILVALYGANSGDVALAKIDGAINQAILCLRSELSNEFIYQVLSHKKDWVVATYIQGGQGNLSGEIVKSISVLFPARDEQQKIADCLSSLDELIAAQARKVDALKTHKKGLMQQLFPREGETQPRLRFPEFRGTGEWEESSLSTFVESLDAGVSVNSGDRPSDMTEFGVLKTSAVTNGVFESNENKVVLAECEQIRLKEPVKGGTIIISRMNTPALVGANAYVEFSHENLFLPDRLWAAKPKEGTSMRFLASILGSEKGRAALSKLAKGSSGSMKNITKPDVLAFLVMSPKPLEQQRIADCLTSLDDLITAATQELATLKTHKKALMQQLFPREGETQPRLRFPEFRTVGEWTPKTIGQLGEVITGSTPSTVKLEYYGGDMLFVSPADISDERFIEKTKTTLTELGFLETRPVKANSILFVCIGSTIGKIAQNKNECATNQQINAVIPNPENSDGFVYYALSGIADKIVNLAGRQAVPIVNKSLFSSVELMVPKLPEQKRIANFLSSLDEAIFAESQKLETLKTYKKGLMQQLFPSMEEAV